MHREITVDEYNGRLTIVVPWRLSVPSLVTWTLLALLACLCFGGIAAGLFIDKGDAAPIGGLAFCGLAIAGVSYAMSAYWLNRTMIEVMRDSIHVSHGPLPFPRSRSFAIERDDIDQVYVQTMNEATKHGPIRVSYQVCAVLDSGDRVRLFDCGYETRHNKDEARAVGERLESQIETFLGIEDRPVDASVVTVGVSVPLMPGP